MSSTDLARRVFITVCMLTRSTGLAARWLGARFFLPALFVKRYSAMGMIAERVFAQQLENVRSFRDQEWCAYWNGLAASELAQAERVVPGIANGAIEAMHALVENSGASLVHALSAGAPRGDDGAADAEQAGDVVAALRHLVRAITYYQVGAFPGGSEARMDAYRSSRRLFDRLLALLAPVLDVTVERRRVVVENDVVDGYLILPSGGSPCPVVIISNGLEGTVQELVIPLLRYQQSGLAVFVMEMPGSYAYRVRMSVASESIYHRVIDDVAAHPRVDARRMGFVGVSFGGYWAARMALTSKRLSCVVACGAPTHHSFLPARSVGIPDIIVRALLQVTGATNFHQLGLKLKALSLQESYARISVPLLVINGDDDTLLSTQDSVELAQGAQDGTLVLYPGDDHCAMGHYREWLDMSQVWLQQQLLASGPHPASGSTPASGG